ncbi:MAG: DNA (cytosine-5-)-methyltransferase [Gammaproteobacteria bacterium]|nr:DNA (cytosine-5-)-methyltransferase [Gammaproteobacteria bacterium]
MAVAGLFAGIGGFELAFSRAGFGTNLLVEIDPAARAVLRARFPDATVHSDVRLLSRLPPDTEIVTAGFPCQNLSMAGDKAGISGRKSGVVESLFQLIEKSRVPAVLIENVYFMLQLDSGTAMDWLVTRLEDLGFLWAYRVVDTMGFGLPQRRRRVYLLATRDHADPREVLLADDRAALEAPTPGLEHPLGFYWTEGRSGVGLTVDGIPPLKVGSALGIPSPPAVLFPDGEVLVPSLRACENLQGFPSGWTEVEGGHEKRNPGWRMVGNAVSVPVAQWVAERIRTPRPTLQFEETAIEKGVRWPEAGWNVGAGRVGVVAGDRPIAMKAESIARFRDDSWSRLSERALKGFVSRAEEGGLRMPDGFLEAVATAVRKPAG